VLSVSDAFVEIDQAHYSLGHAKYVGDAWQAKLVRDEMNSVLENIVEAMNEELQVAFDTHFGTDENNWKTINLLETVRLVVAQAASRFTVGLPLCTYGRNATCHLLFPIVAYILSQAAMTSIFMTP
jgi:hypothetical protein